MAIDSIEHNDLSALGKSRLGGMKRFIDDKEVNYVGSEDFMNLFGSRKKKKNAYRQEIEDKYNQLPSDCENIDSSIEYINSDIEILVGRSGTAKGNEKLKVREQLDESARILGEFKNKKIALGCSKEQAKIQDEAQKKESLDLFTKLSETSLLGAKQDLAQSSSTKKWILYGGIALGVVLIAAIVIKIKK